jgi:hypothetical protein
MMIYEGGGADDEHLGVNTLEGYLFVECSQDARIQAILILRAEYIGSERVLSLLQHLWNFESHH